MKPKVGMVRQLNHLSSNFSLDKSGNVGVRPLGGRPGRHLAQVGTEVHCLDLVMDELADVPWQVIVAEEVTGLVWLCLGRKGWIPPIYERRLLEQLGDHPQAVVGVLQARRPAREGGHGGLVDQTHLLAIGR